MELRGVGWGSPATGKKTGAGGLRGDVEGSGGPAEAEVGEGGVARRLRERRRPRAVEAGAERASSLSATHLFFLYSSGWRRFSLSSPSSFHYHT
jgi:hypothetical protein